MFSTSLYMKGNENEGKLNSSLTLSARNGAYPSPPPPIMSLISHIQARCHRTTTVDGHWPPEAHQVHAASFLQEVFRCPPSHIGLSSPRSWLKLNECMSLAVINFQDGSHVSASITIVWCAEYSHNVLFLPKQGLNYTNPVS